jgi:ABC-type sugar transport system ATPase subunit
LEAEKLLVLEHISKVFPGVKALDNINIELLKDEVLALVGENGAGKSTLIKIISGAYQQDEGTILFDGKNMGKLVPHQSLALGISVIYQELNYFPDMTVAENIFMGTQPHKGFMVDYKKLGEESLSLQREVGLGYLDPFTKVGELSTAEKQLLEIARAYSRDLKILVLDEPTSALNEKETTRLFELIKKLKTQGKSVIYISHKLDEIFEIADRVQILRDGKSVAVSPIGGISREEIIHHMVGREIKDMYPIGERKIQEVILEIKKLSGAYIKDISIFVRRGEIVGLYGLMGAGCSEILESIFGYEQYREGEIVINGVRVDIKNPRTAISHGFAYVPSERKTEGLITGLSVKYNITTVTLGNYTMGPVLNLKKETQSALGWVKKLNIRTPSVNTISNNLSGGNQQKVILSKWMDNNPSVFLMNEPTKGIDVGSKVEIYKQIEVLCNSGCGILLVTAELPELMMICDRVYVIHAGTMSGEFEKGRMTQEEIIQRAIGE